jgi:hypothetical protein
LTPEAGGSGGSEQASVAEPRPPVQAGAPVQAPETQQAAQAGGRRTQLRIVKENVQSLSKDVGDFRKSHEVSTKRLEKQLASLRSDLAAHARSMDAGSLRKSGEANTKRLEKQVATLRKELGALKGSIAKDTARDRAKQEVILSKILAKVGAKASKPAKRAKKR